MNNLTQKRIIWLFTAMISVIVFPKIANAQQVAIHTDVMQDALKIPNLGLELYIDDAHTVQFSAFATSGPWTMDMKAGGVQATYRYWLSGRALTREFIGLNSLFTTYRYTNKSNRIRKGDAVGLGFAFGYAWPLTKRMSLTAHSSLGVAYYRQKEHYSYDDITSLWEHDQFPNSKGLCLVPLNFGVTISYIIK